jgi:hypothetical protein
MAPDSILDNWLEIKVKEVLSKIDNEPFTTQDMIILILKQNNDYIKSRSLKNKRADSSLFDTP